MVKDKAKDMAKQRVRTGRATKRKINAIVDELLKRWDLLPVPALTDKALTERLERNGQILASLLERLTKNLDPGDRARVLEKIDLRRNGRHDLPGRVKQVVARRRLAELLGEVEWCMKCLDPEDRHAITALREFAKQHDAWQIFVEEEDRDRKKHFAHLEKVGKLGRDHLERELDRIQDAGDRHRQHPLRPEQSREIDRWLKQRGADRSDIASIRGETEDAERKRRRRAARSRDETHGQRKQRLAREAAQKREQRRRMRK